MLRDIASIRDDLTETSATGKLLRPPVQGLLLSLGWGNERVLKGKDSYLFFRPTVEYLSGRGFMDPVFQQQRIISAESWETAPIPDPLPAILEFSSQLEDRGISLILLPVPVKAGVIPEKLCSRLHPDEILHNSSWEKFQLKLRDHHVEVVDIDRASLGRNEAFLHCDSHWTWIAMDRVAQKLAKMLHQQGVKNNGVFHQSEVQVSGRGDLFRMLPLLSDQAYPKEKIRIHPVSGSAEDGASILLLGDSFANIYSDDQLGWGAHAGLAERLSFHLQAPVESILRNDDGAEATRRELARRLKRNPDFLRGKRYLIWEFTERELSFGDWRPVDLGRQSTSAVKAQDETSFIRLKSGEKLHITGIIRKMGNPPDPEEAAYPDYLIALYLDEIESGGGRCCKKALVFIRAMKNYRVLEGGKLQPGQRISLTIRPWSDVSASLGSIARGEIFDPELLDQEPCWGEELSQ